MDEHAVGGLPLAAVACYSITMVQMRILPNVERDRTTRVQTDSEVANFVDFLDSAQFTVGDMLVSIRSGELYAVAFTERPLCLCLANCNFDSHRAWPNVASRRRMSLISKALLILAEHNFPDPFPATRCDPTFRM